MTSIIISRKYAYPDSWRVYEVIINGKNEGEVESDEIIEIPVPPGEIIIYLRLDYFFRSQKIRTKVLPGQNVCFTCQPLEGWWFSIPLFGFLFRFYRHINFERVESIDLSPNNNDDEY
ncbi:MAG: hypothetical protein ACQ9MH_14300 [Nitrospinales bacterium]